MSLPLLCSTVLDKTTLRFYYSSRMKLSPKQSETRSNTIQMSITHADPLANLRLFEDAFTRMLSEPRAGRPWSPAVDIFETEDELVLKADVPEVELKDIDVRV